LESSRRDGSNGANFMFLASIDGELFLLIIAMLSRDLTMIEI